MRSRSRARVRPLFVRPDLRPPDRRRRCGRTNSSSRSRKPPSICRSISSPSSRRRRSSALHAAGKLKTPDEATARALYDVTQESARAHGLPAYEISNHARPGAECRHNLVYWRGEEYAGIGPARMAGSISTAPARDRDREAPRGLADARRGARPWRRHRRSPQQRRARRRIPADGIAARRGHRSQRYAALSGRALDPGRIACCAKKAPSSSMPTAGCA
jgi:hypothetical protein